MIEKGLSRPNAVLAPPPATLNAILAQIMARDVFGMPVAFIACALAAVVFGGLLAMTAGGH
jgi:hypothetical protein